MNEEIELTEEQKRLIALNKKLDLLDFMKQLRKSVADVAFFMDRVDCIIDTKAIIDGELNPIYTEAVNFTEQELLDAVELLNQLKGLTVNKGNWVLFNK